MTATVDAARLLRLRSIAGPSGALTPVHSGVDIPFDIARVFYLNDVPAGAHRGGHAHRRLEQVIVAAIGSIKVELDDGHRRRTVDLRRPDIGLYVPRMLWSELVDFAAGSTVIVLASIPFDEAEYVRDHAEYLRICRDPPAGGSGDRRTSDGARPSIRSRRSA